MRTLIKFRQTKCIFMKYDMFCFICCITAHCLTSIMFKGPVTRHNPDGCSNAHQSVCVMTETQAVRGLSKSAFSLRWGGGALLGEETFALG